MPLTSTQKAEILKKLRYWFNSTDEYPAEPGRSLEFSEQVKSDVNEIYNKGLHKKVDGWGYRCGVARVENGYTYEEIGELIGVHHKSIQEQEKKDRPATNDSFYLEAFSLIYHHSPYTLLGVQSPHLSCPFVSRSNQNSKYRNVIINSLYDESNPNKLAYLETITKIGKTASPQYTKLISSLKDMAIFSSTLNISPLEDPAAESDDWRGIPLPHLLDSDEYGSSLYHQRRIFWEAQYVLNDLEKHNPARLHVLAQLALCGSDAANILKTIVIDAGFPKDPKSLKKYDVDSILIRSSNKKEKLRKIRPYDTPSVLVQNGEKTTSGVYRKNVSIRNVVYYYPYFAFNDCADEQHVVLRSNKICTFILGNSTELTEFLLALHNNKTTYNTHTLLHNTGKELKDTYRFDLSDGYVDCKEGRMNLTEEQISTIRHILELEIAQFCKLVEVELLDL